MSDRSWCVTLHDYTDSDIAMFQNWSTEVARMVISREVSASGSPHLQGEITFRRTYRAPALKKLCPRAHWELKKAGQDHLYPMKSGSDLIINVDNRRQGKRTDLDDAIATLRERNNIRDVKLRHPNVYVKYHAGLEKLCLPDAPRQLVNPPIIHIYQGASRTGKSTAAFRYAEEHYGGEYYKWSPQNGLWFDGYRGQKCMIFEEFTGQIPVKVMQDIVDTRECRLPVKNSFVQCVAECFLFTSNYDYRGWWKTVSQTAFNERVREWGIVHTEFGECFDANDPALNL